MLLLLAVALFGSACDASKPIGSPSPSAGPSASAGPSLPTASPSPTPFVDPAIVYSTIEDQVLALRGLAAKSPVAPIVLDEAGLRKLVGELFRKDNPEALIEANERMLKAFGLLPPDESLADLYLELFGSQVAGMYNPEDKKLYVVSKSGGLGVTEKSTFAHEFTHALQDQNFDLGSLKLDEVGQSDRSYARLALVEGDATLVMSYWQLQSLTQDELGSMLGGALDDPSTKVLLEMPPILRESLLFPYLSGLTFVQGLQASGGWEAVDAAYAQPPASTEQILHPEKYATGEKPIAVRLPGDLATRLGAGWKVALEDGFGEFQLGIWLRGNTTIGIGGANQAAAGWGGDRAVLLNGPDGTWGVVLRTAWDTDADAAEFEAAAGSLVDGLASPGALLPGTGGTERWVLIASDEPTLNRLSGVLGLAG